jgi:hypothetical protein
MWRYVLAAVATAIILIGIKTIHFGSMFANGLRIGNLSSLSDLSHLDEADSSYQWSGPLPAGRWTTVRGVAGNIVVLPSPDSLVHVAAIKRWKSGEAADARVLTQPNDSGLTVCVALAGESRCALRRGRSFHFNQRVSVAMDLTLRVPVGTKVDAETILGDVTLDSTRDTVRARTVSGRLRLTALGGPVNAHSVNGSIVATLDSAAARNPVSLETVNGAVTARVPADFAGSVTLHTVNGSLGSDLPISTTGEQGRRRLVGTIGSGGSSLSLIAVNGSVHLRKIGQTSDLAPAVEPDSGG